MIEALRQVAVRGGQLAVFPELGLTGYTCADLFYQTLLLDQARHALLTIAAAVADQHVAAVVGLPLAIDGRLFNCAAFIDESGVLGVVPKSYLPNSAEYYEARWFTPASHRSTDQVILNGRVVPFGTDLLFRARAMPECVIGIEICEDLWAVNPPSGVQALAGATLLLNPSAGDELLGKAAYRRDLVRQQSARCLAAYLYAGAGPGESTTDVVFGGHSLIADNGSLITETERFRFDTQIALADLDMQRLTVERRKNTTFSAGGEPSRFRLIDFDMPSIAAALPGADRLLASLSPTPFIPADVRQQARNCEEVFNIQATGLAKRLRHTGIKRVSLGLSGGLDSTLALLVTIRAFDQLGLDRAGIVAVTMPGFGTTTRTRGNAEQLAALLGIGLRTIPITDAVRQHFRDIGHDEAAHDVTYENAQARERTQILMDIANQIGGLTIGTGDLSELALGWATYNGDQMSMYHVNAGVPKTLVRYVIAWCAEALFSGDVARVLLDINATPITPELLPLGADDALQQETEVTVGPYRLHDFFLFYVIRYSFPPRKVYFLACQAFANEFPPETIRHWLGVFYARFFANQFKRSAMPDAPKVGSVALSPRGDWRMPSDAAVALWQRDLAALSDDPPSSG